MGLFLAATVAATAYVAYPTECPDISFPGGRRFAFTIVDDTDQTYLRTIVPIYDAMQRRGIRTTKTVWVLPGGDTGRPVDCGHTLADTAYRHWIEELRASGFEIALHGVRGGTSRRDDILRAFETYHVILGEFPAMHINHSQNLDNLYWGEHRWTFAPYRFLHQAVIASEFSGHAPNSPFFWGDIAAERIRYVRSFTFREPNLLNVVPGTPYHLDEKPFVNYWFPGADGGNMDKFEELLSSENLDRLEREGGVVIVYAHLGAGSFSSDDGQVNPRFLERIADISSRNGWFVPATAALDHLREQPGWTGKLRFRERLQMETRFIIERLGDL
jgi:hypothetical protein